MQKKKAFGRNKKKTNNIDPNKLKVNIPPAINRNKPRKGNKKFTKLEKRLHRYYNCEPEVTEEGNTIVVDAETSFKEVATDLQKQYRILPEHY